MALADAYVFTLLLGASLAEMCAWSPDLLEERIRMRNLSATERRHMVTSLSRLLIQINGCAMACCIEKKRREKASRRCSLFSFYAQRIFSVLAVLAVDAAQMDLIAHTCAAFQT